MTTVAHKSNSQTNSVTTHQLNHNSSYLSNREFYVSIDNHMSDKATIASGLPQGSILGPLLFVIYMNDLPLHISNSNVELFADDATLLVYASGSTLNEVEQQLGDETIPLVQWINDNSMVLSKEKTKAMAVATSRKHADLREFMVTIDGSIIQSVLQERILGIHFDHCLNWSVHIDIIHKKISQRLGILRRFRHLLPLPARLAIYNCLILSLMDYCCVVWGNTSKENLDRIHRLQKCAARLIQDAYYKAPSLPLFIKLNWLPIYERIKYFRCLTVFKTLDNLAPSFLQDLVTPFNTVHNFKTRGSGDNLLQLPKVSSESGRRTFKFLAASDWNSLLDRSIRNSSSLYSFKHSFFKTTFERQRC